MNLSHDNTAARVLLAAVPVLAVTADLAHAVYFGIFFALFFWLTAAFFCLMAAGFPQRLRRSAYVLWLAMLAQAGFVYFDMPPLWILSVLFLMPLESMEQKDGLTAIFKRSFLQSLFFIVLLLFLGVFHQILGERFLVWSFHLPAGSLLLLSLAAVLWQNQPGGSFKIPERTEV